MLSIIVPVLNEAESLETLHHEIGETARGLSLPVEMIFVDDGSTDTSWSVIQTLAGRDPSVSGIRFRRNFGKAAALTAGMRKAQGELILTIDADLQDDPAELPQLLGKLDQGFDVVNGWKERRLDPWHKIYPSRVFNSVVSRITGLKLHDHNCGLKLFRAGVAAEIRLYGELHRFIPVLAHARGFRVAEVPVHHRPRRFGQSKYGVRRFARGFLDLLTVTFLTGFGQRPQHILGGIGLCFLGLGCCGLFYLTVLWCCTNVFGANFGQLEHGRCSPIRSPLPCWEHRPCHWDCWQNCWPRTRERKAIPTAFGKRRGAVETTSPASLMQPELAGQPAAQRSDTGA